MKSVDHSNVRTCDTKAMDAVEAYDTVVEDVDGALIHGPSGTLVPVGGKVNCGPTSSVVNDSIKQLSNRASKQVQISP